MQIYDGRESFYQWDLNQKITSDEFEVGDKIHFFNMRQTNALVVKAYELGGVVVADVPNILLQTAQPITVWKYVYDEHSAQTVMEDTFKVEQRPQPYDYFYTETELYELRKEIDQAVIDANNAVAQLQEALDNAENALELANQAIEAATTAEETSSKNEQSRVDAEEERVSNESDRIVAEVERENAEEDRLDAEAIREGNETNRVGAEVARIEYENNRRFSEDNRQIAESARENYENRRNTSEAQRAAKESQRVGAEAGRQSNEAVRAENERLRLNAEQLRIEAETNRASAEQDRIAAEEIRKANFESLPNNIGNAIKGFASGEVVRVDDVSPIEHTAKVKVSGKNLFDMSKIESDGNLTNNGDGTVTVAANAYGVSSGKTLHELCPTLEAGKIYALSGTTQSVLSKYIYLTIAGFTWNYGTARVMTEDMLNSKVNIYGMHSAEADNGKECVVSNIQIELGDTATEYEPYIDPATVTLTVQDASGENVATYTPSEDGIANVASLSPTMVLSTNTEGVTIDLEYNQDTNKVVNAVREDIRALDDVVAKLASQTSLVDSKTGKSYKLYVSDGKLMLAESEN